MARSDFRKAKVAKKDEFYTQLTDIEKELKYYRKHFKDKVVLCNCDDPYESNFFKYFAANFNTLGLKKLITTCYKGSPVVNTELNTNGNKAFKLEITEVKDFNGDSRIDLSDVEWLIQNDKNVITNLKGDGDFKSDECIEILKEADIVVTNPPFSLFREYVAQLIEYKKNFIIIGNQNATSYKEIFPLIKDNKIWFGPSIHSGDREFRVPEGYPLTASGCRKDEHGNKYVRVKGIRWFTNIEHNQRHKNFDLYAQYKPAKYPKYDNYNAINVDVSAETPCNYKGVMGVPITFLDKYCPNQFEIIGLMSGAKGKDLINGNDGRVKFYLNNKGVYARILIKYTNEWIKKHPQDFEE